MNNFRSTCPISSALDVMGDKWTLLIVRDMLVFQKSTFKDFENSDEKIASNILASRLKLLERSAVVTKHKLKTNKKTNTYLLTSKGYDLAHILVGFISWSDKHLSDVHPDIQTIDIGKDKNETIVMTQAIVDSYIDFREAELNLCV